MKRTLVAVMPFVLLLGLPASAEMQMQQLEPVKTPPPQAQQRSQGATARGSAAPAAGADAALSQRVEQLEEQLIDLQVVIGTLETFARSGARNQAAPSQYGEQGGYGAYDGNRMDGIETQIRALTAQMESLSQQVRALGGQGQIGEAAATPPPPARTASVQPPQMPATTATVQPPQTAGAMAADRPPPTEARFGSTTVTSGSTTVTSGEADPIGGLIAGQQGNDVPRQDMAAAAQAAPTGFGEQSVSPGPGQPPGQNLAAVEPMPPAAPDGFGEPSVNPKQLYETAYGYLLQQQYAEAEAAFSDFLQRFPNDSLAGNAQYWLGESYFVRGQYKQAAGAFLKGFQTYAQNAKAPDSLLKLAMSLDRLGQKDAACSSYAELDTRFPTAPPHIKNRAQSERHRIGCT